MSTPSEQGNNKPQIPLEVFDKGERVATRQLATGILLMCALGIGIGLSMLVANKHPEIVTCIVVVFFLVAVSIAPVAFRAD